MKPDSTALGSDALLAQMEWVRELAGRLVRDPSDADDVAQEVWMTAVERPPAVTTDVRRWLQVVTRRVVQGMGRSASRRRRREAQAARTDAALDHSDVLARGETCQRLVAAVMALDEPYRSTVLHRYLDGSSTKQIAALDHSSELVVRKRLSRAMHQLRARLDGEFEGGRGAWMAALAGLRHPFSSGIAVGVGVGGFLLMKKVLVVVALVMALGAVWLAMASRDSLHPNNNADQGTEKAALVGPAARPVLETTGTTDPGRTDAVPSPTGTPKTVGVDGIVLDIPYPDTTLEPVPAPDVQLTLRLQDTGFPPKIIDASGRSGADGRFHLELTDPGLQQRIMYLTAAGDDRFRTRSKSWDLATNAPVGPVRLERAAHGDLSGIVIGEDGLPLAEAIVKCDYDGSSSSRTKAAVVQIVTSDLGTFTFPSAHRAGGFYPGAPVLTATKAGMRMLPIGPGNPLTRGGWDPVTIHMVPAGGQLAVTVVDEHDRPRSDVDVAVSVSSAEPGASWEAWYGEATGSIDESSDGEGRVTLKDVWIGKKLEIEIHSGLGSWTRERALNGRIDVRSPAAGDAIVLPPSGKLELRVVLPTSIKLVANVVGPTGEAVPDATITLSAKDPTVSSGGGFSGFRSGTNGQFVHELSRPAAAYSLRVSASVGTESSGASIMAMMGTATIEVAPDSPDELTVELELQPALTITGTVHEKDGRACEGHVVAIPRGALAFEYSRGAGSAIGPKGRFEMRGLLPGPYDIDVRPARNYVFTDCLLSQRFTGIAAGSHDLELVLGEDNAVNVEIEVASAEGPVAAMTVVTGIVHLYENRDPAGSSPEFHQTFSGSGGWPKEATLNFGGQSGGVDSEGVTGFLHLGGDVPVDRLKPMNPGWYCFGIDASDAAGQRYHACGTGLVYLEPGTYRFHFDLVRQSALEGRIDGEKLPANLCIGLFDGAGKPIQILRTNRHVGDIVPVGADGRFALNGVPVGKLRLRVGPEEMLRAGQSLREQSVTVAAGENPRLVIHLP